MMHDIWNSSALEEMRKSFRSAWQTQIAKAGAPLLPPNFHFEIYRDSLIGLNEIVRGLLEFFPHKRTIAIVGGTTPKVSSFLTGLSKDGVVCKDIPLELAEKNPAEALALCDADTLMVISGTADPLTARFFNLSPFCELLVLKKIFSVELSPFLPAVSFTSRVGSPYRAQLVSITSSLAVAVLGSRAKGPQLIMGSPFFNDDDLQKLNAQLKSTFTDEALDYKKLIQSFESKCEYFEASRFFADNSLRIWDRAVIRFEDVDGFALLELLCEHKKIKFSDSLGSDFDTASGCRWSEWNFTSWLVAQGIPLEKQRALVLFSARFLAQNSDLADNLLIAVNGLRKMQNG